MQIQSPRSLPYPIDLGYKDVRTGMYSEFVFDRDGIPMYPYSGGASYNITFVCHFALYRLSLFQRFAEVSGRKDFLRLARWISDFGDEQDGVLKFYYRHSVPGLKAPWISALGQGRAISVFVRAFEETGEEYFLDLARKTRRALEIPVSQGGVQAAFPDGGIAFEEYPRSTPNLVLNGMITAVFGLADLARHGCEPTRRLYESAITSLERNIGRYDLGYASLYDLTGPVARIGSWEYHEYHVMQLWALFELTGLERFKTVADRWGQYNRGFLWQISRHGSRAIHRLIR